MNKLEVLFSKYAESHQNPVNVRIHKVAVPTILLTSLGFLWPVQWAGIPLAAVASVGLFIFAVSLSRPIAALFLMELALFNAGLWAVYSHVSTGVGLSVMAATFALAWVGQFVGHRIEGKKPSFFDDLLFLFVGPLWTLHFLLPRPTRQ